MIKLQDIYSKAEIDEDLLLPEELAIYEENYDIEILESFINELEQYKKTIKTIQLFRIYQGLIRQLDRNERMFNSSPPYWMDLSMANNFEFVEKYCAGVVKR